MGKGDSEALVAVRAWLDSLMRASPRHLPDAGVRERGAIEDPYVAGVRLGGITCHSQSERMQGKDRIWGREQSLLLHVTLQGLRTFLCSTTLSGMSTISKKKPFPFLGHQYFQKVLFKTFPLEFISC